jgi:hypothetical protein
MQTAIQVAANLHNDDIVIQVSCHRDRREMRLGEMVRNINRHATQQIIRMQRKYINAYNNGAHRLGKVTLSYVQASGGASRIDKIVLLERHPPACHRYRHEHSLRGGSNAMAYPRTFNMRGGSSNMLEFIPGSAAKHYKSTLVLSTIPSIH